MSLLLGPLSGALVAGGVYYGFSTMIQTRTERHCSDLQTLSRRLLDASAEVAAPPPASQRIVHRPFASLMQDQWNRQVESLFHEIGELHKKGSEWGRRVLYGGNADSTKGT